jgi:hypothetical protein
LLYPDYGDVLMKGIPHGGRSLARRLALLDVFNVVSSPVGLELVVRTILKFNKYIRMSMNTHGSWEKVDEDGTRADEFALAAKRGSSIRTGLPIMCARQPPIVRNSTNFA